MKRIGIIQAVFCFGGGGGGSQPAPMAPAPVSDTPAPGGGDAKQRFAEIRSGTSFTEQPAQGVLDPTSASYGNASKGTVLGSTR